MLHSIVTECLFITF